MRSWLGGALIVSAMLAHAVAADTLRGQVRAADQAPLAGATVVATGPALAATQAEITDEDGDFVMELPTGTYVITFYYADQQTERRDIELAPARMTILNVVLDPPKASEVIIVDRDLHCCGGGPCESPEGITLDQSYFKNIPGRQPPAPVPSAPPASSAKAHGCAHCASGGGDASAIGALLVLAVLLRRRAPVTWTRPARRA